MSLPVISVENLGKRYTIRHQTGRPPGGYGRLSEDLVRVVQAPFRALASRLRGNVRASPLSGGESAEDFWALRDVSFDVRESEVIGIIGRNGAGKSTLLKILSRITEPSEGRVRIRGRVASLLEVGTGFHGELTGRENIFLNGTILGMSRTEIRRKFDEIVAFAEVERFLDTPVKRYSSGMYVRLAFSVAAQLELEVLVVDEVLAVGDATFQRKCLGRMHEVGKSGRTVLFVSHNMPAIQALCSRGIVLSCGRSIFDGAADAAITSYLSSIQGQEGGSDLRSVTDRSGSQRVRFTHVHFENDDGERCTSFPMGSPMIVVLQFDCAEPTSGLFFGIVISDSMDRRVFRVQSSVNPGTPAPRCEKGGVARCRIPRIALVDDSYSVTIGVDQGAQSQDHIVRAATFEITQADVYGTGRCPSRHGGPVFVDYDWHFDIC